MRILIDQEEINRGIRDLADWTHREFGDKPLTVVGVMTGSLLMLADLVRHLRMPLCIGLIQASSYRGGTQSGNLRVVDTMLPQLQGRNVLLIDDIFDTGQTLESLYRPCLKEEPAQLKTAVLLRKEGVSRTIFQPDHTVFTIPDEFVVGYGLDYDEQYRNLPYIGVFEACDQAAHQRA
ncbi:MAG: hypoxanthine phosphoribosyltransferase [Pirellulaceae bacterium]